MHMSRPTQRNMVSMLNQLQSQVVFDHTEAGFFGTDYSGTERAQLRQEIAEKDRHIQQLIQERQWLQTNAQRHLTYLQSNSTQAIHGLRGAFGVFEERIRVFEERIRSDGVALQQMMQQDALARQTATHQ